jgi:hypothetical protein
VGFLKSRVLQVRLDSVSVYGLYLCFSSVQSFSLSFSFLVSSKKEQNTIKEPQQSLNMLKFLSPHPLCPFLETNALWKILPPFCICIIALTTYSTMDRILPANGTYSSIEYAFHRPQLQSIIDSMNKAQFCTVGFSAGLHLLNALMYATTLSFTCAYVALKCRTQLSWFARIGDFLIWLQPLECAFYFVQHITILVQFITQTAKDNLPELTAAMSIMFLVIVGISVIYTLIGLAILWRCRCGSCGWMWVWMWVCGCGYSEGRCWCE